MRGAHGIELGFGHGLQRRHMRARPSICRLLRLGLRVMDRIASLFSSPRVSFSSGAVATKMAEGSERRVRLLRYNNLKGKSGNKSLTLLLLLNDSTYASLNRRALTAR